MAAYYNPRTQGKEAEVQEILLWLCVPRA